MQNTILINAIDHERGELRVATIKNGILDNLIIENETTKITKGNIYLGTITSDVPSLEAYFVSFGSDKHGFLPYKELADATQDNPPKKLKVGHSLLVQIDKEERGSKGAALTGQISIAGQYLVAMPFSPESRGISKNIDPDQRNAVRERMDAMQIPEGMGLILRTAGQGQSLETLQYDFDGLCYLWQQIQESIKAAKAPALIFQEYQGIFKALRDTAKQDIDQIIIDNEALLPNVKAFLKQIQPELSERVALHKSQVPIFTHHQIEDFIESLYSREVQLKSGGKLFIDKTEALYAIDVNSAQATGASTIENTAFETNIEAVEHIAQLLKLRDINGIIIIDLIDMSDDKHKAKVVETFQQKLKNDSSKIQVSDLSRLGLLEVSRQRMRPSLAESHLITCPQCHGRGFVRSTESFSYSLLHIIEQHAIHGKTSHILVQVPVEVASYLCNEKRATLTAIEQRQGVAINVIGNPHYMVPKYQIKRIRAADASFGDPSYSHIQTPSMDLDQSHYATDHLKNKPKQKPMVTFDDRQDLPRRKRRKPSKGGLIARIVEALVGKKEATTTTKKRRRPQQQNKNQQRRGSQDNRRQRHAQGQNKSSNRRSQSRRQGQQRPKHSNNRRGPNAAAKGNNASVKTNDDTRQTKREDASSKAQTRHQSQTAPEKSGNANTTQTNTVPKQTANNNKPPKQKSEAQTAKKSVDANTKPTNKTVANDSSVVD